MSVFFVSCGIKGPPLPPIDQNTQRQKNINLINSDKLTSKPSSADQTKAKPKNNKK